jgi:hypothetical protein
VALSLVVPRRKGKQREGRRLHRGRAGVGNVSTREVEPVFSDD